MGSSKKDIRDFPDGAQKLLGDELQLVQFGGMPKDVKPFKGVGSGVLEIALRYALTHTGSSWPCRLGREFMSCTPFRRSRKKALRPRSGMLT
jgi:phage-related protein